MDYLFLVILIILLCIDIKYYSNFDKLKYIDINQTNTLKGICAIVIFIHHISSEFNGILFLEWGFLSVCVFLFLSAFGLTRKWSKYNLKTASDIFCVKIPQLVAISVFTIIYKVFYLIIIGEKITFKEIVVGALTGNKVLNWFFPVIIVLYTLFAISIVIIEKMHIKNKRQLVLINIIEITIFSCLLFVFFIKGYILIHWLISLYAFPLGVFYALEDINKYQKDGEKNKILFISFLFLILMVLCYRVDANGIFLVQIVKMSWYYILSILICIIVYYFIRYRCSKTVFKFVGKYSAEIILTQNMAITMLRNEKIYINNNLWYFIFTVLIQILLVIILSPIYREIKKVVKIQGEKIIRRKDG